MEEIIATIILISSLAGMGIILSSKVLVLKELPRVQTQNFSESFFKTTKNEIKKIFLKFFSFDLLLQKILSRFRILTLRAENKSFIWLQKLREKKKREKNKEKEDNNYWQNVKESINDKIDY